MADYLSYRFEDTQDFVRTYDELPLWSASFGLMLLQHIDYKPNITILDIGCGTGFPFTEIASRFGASCTCYGLDVWTNANERAKEKINHYGLKNAKLLAASADAIPLPNDSIDLIVSNLGINNFEEPDKVFKECKRVLNANGKLALTTNLFGHWHEFYTVFEQVLNELNMPKEFALLKEQQQARGTIETVSKLFTNNGFEVSRHIEDSFEMKFADGSAFLNHHFVKLGWLGSWLTIITQDDRATVFSLLEKKLNTLAEEKGQLNLTVPMAFVEGVCS